MYSWGCNGDGQLGLGDNTDRNKPENISTLNNHRIVSISCGNYHSATITGISLFHNCESHQIQKMVIFMNGAQ